MRLSKFFSLLVALPLVIPFAANAQRTTENAVTQSGDAFGRSVGNERVGLYSSEDIRGFNPIDAGNARIEGLYFDQQDRIPTRLIEGNTIRVGISAQRYPFPAPTGIVDYPLALADEKLEASLEMERGPYGGVAGSIEVKIPVSDDLGIAGGVGARHQVRPEGGTNNFRNFGISLAWRPYDGALVAPFFGGYFNHGDEARPVIFPVANALPSIPREKFLGQDWADRNWVNRTYGVIAKLPMGAFRVEAGMFHSFRKTRSTYADILTGVNADGSAASRTIIADGNNMDDSISGEARLLRNWEAGNVRHTVIASVRGRSKDRLFGGTRTIALGPGSAISPDRRGQPALSLGLENEDRVRQVTFGAGYSLNWSGRGSLDLSLSKSDYRKTVNFATAPSLPLVTRDRPILWSATGSILLSKRLAFYGGYVRGLEEAPIAPDVAANRNEAPPAIDTQQIDFGLRYALTPRLSLVAGLFSVKKPYFNLDSAARFRRLGEVDNRGLEISLAGELTKGITIVSGSIFLDPVISGEAVTVGQIGRRPVGSSKRRSILNLDWRTDGGQGPLSFDLGLESLSARTGNARNTIIAPARETVNIGARYRFPIGPYRALARLQVTNLFNQYGWQVSTSGAFTPASSRTWLAQLAADF